MKTLSEVREILQAVRAKFGRARAVDIINEHGQAQSIADIPEELFDIVYAKARRVLHPEELTELQKARNAVNRLVVASQKLSEAAMFFASAAEDPDLDYLTELLNKPTVTIALGETVDKP